MPKDKKLFSKIFILAILFLMVIGFSVPLFNLGGNNSNQPQQAEPRLCQSDSDCYLVCDDKPLTILCSQNLCLQNDCNEYALYPFQETPVTFNLKIEVDTTELDLATRTDPKDLMIKFGKDVQLFSWGMPLVFILEKVDMTLNENCLTVGTQAYCTNDNGKLQFLLNGNETLPNPQYYPKEGDEIEIRYS